VQRITAWLLAQDRRFWTQAALLAAVVALLGVIAANVAANLERQPFRFGLDFLWRPAGFSILQTLIPFNESSTFGRAVIVGLLNTLLVAVIGIAAATVLGFAVGLARLAPNRLLRWLAAGYVELFRNLPLLLILFFWYFGILRQLPPPRQTLTLGGVYLNNRGLFLPSPVLEGHTLGLLSLALAAFLVSRFLKGRERTIGVAAGALACLLALSIASVSWPHPQGLSFSGGVRLIPEFVALVLALAIYTAAYIAEIVRAGIESVPRGQLEAADALGLTNWQSARLVVIPQAMRLIIPPLTSQYLNLTKNSSLAVAIAYPDLVSVFAGTVLGQKGHAVEILAITMGVYLSLSLATAAFLNWLNARGWT
jgi:general L-amino acid transport system permease protein